MLSMAGPDRRKLGRRLFGSCLVFLVFAAVAWFAVSRFLTAVPDPPRTPFAALSSFFLALGAFSFWGLATGGGKSTHSRKALIRRAESGGTPEDGQPIISSGIVRPEGRTLTAPISGTPCVAYFYRMYYLAESRTTSGRVPVVVYWGLASQPFSLQSSREHRRVTAVPRLQIPSTELPDEMMRQAARNWVASTTFSEEENGNLGVVATAFSIADEMFSDEDGATRRDWCQAGANRDMSRLLFEETVVPVGAEAAACGTWSQARNAIVSGDGLNGVLGVTVSLGGPQSIPEDAVANKGMLTYLVTATGLTLVGLGIAWVALRFFTQA
jgi:hypothetical protein